MLATQEGTASTSAVMGLSDFAAKALKVRRHRIPWGIGQVPAKVERAKLPGKDGKEKKDARK